jgi:hypothetical protein|tara:strand:+ start:3067 stop:3990 length:924 start_codon:yes stop_codon:yes gene_type:complete
MDKWNGYIDEARKKKRVPSRKSGKGLEKSLKWFLDKGPQKKGGYPKKGRPNFSKKKFNDISAPPGAAGGLEEEVEEDSFEKKSTLNPKFWKDKRLTKKVSERLTKIAQDFMEGLEVEAHTEDLRFTGSLANYNWSKYSDIDLHIVVDFSKIDDDIEVVKSFFDAVRMRWNDTHDIKIYGYEVELYVENIGESHRSSGIYSLFEDKWLAEPDPRKVEIDFPLARKKSDNITTQVNLLHYIIEKGKYKAALQSIERIKRKIRRMRRAGLESERQEYSAENIAFKILRREDILQKLSDLKYDTYDKLMSM